MTKNHYQVKKINKRNNRRDKKEQENVSKIYHNY